MTENAESATSRDASSSREKWGQSILGLGIVMATASLPLSVRGLQLGGLIAALGALILVLPVWRWPVFWWGTALTGWQLISIAHARWSGLHPDPHHAWGVVACWAFLPLGMAAFAQAWVRRWAVGLLTASVFMAGLILVLRFVIGYHPQGFMGISPQGERWQMYSPSIIGWPDGSNLMVTLYVLAVAVVWLATERLCVQPWWIRLIAITMGGAGVCVTMERAPMLGMCCGSLMAIIVAPGWRIRAITCAVSGLVWVTVCGAMAWRHPGKWEALLQVRDPRWDIWQIGWRITLDHPWLGVGGDQAIGTAMVRMSEAANIPIYGTNSLHNAALVLTAHHGLPAAVLFLGLVTTAVLIAWKGRRSDDGARWRCLLCVLACAGFAGVFIEVTQVVSEMSVVYLALAYAASSTEGDSTSTRLAQ